MFNAYYEYIACFSEAQGATCNRIGSYIYKFVTAAEKDIASHVKSTLGEDPACQNIW